MFLNLHASTKYVGSEDVISIEVDDEEWNEMTAQERGDYEDQMLEENVWQLVDTWITVTDTPA